MAVDVRYVLTSLLAIPVMVFYPHEKRQVPTLIKCVTTGNPDQVSKRIVRIFTFLSRYDTDTKTLPPSETVELRAIIALRLFDDAAR